MNDVIMASVAALKSQSDKAQFSLYTGFRSVRHDGAKSLATPDPERPVTLRVNRQTTAFFERHSDDPKQLMRKVLEDHARQHGMPSER